jgi:hypothetical protein
MVCLPFFVGRSGALGLMIFVKLYGYWLLGSGEGIILPRSDDAPPQFLPPKSHDR